MSTPFSSTPLLLLVADSRFRESLTHTLEAHDYVPVIVGNPSEALQTLKEQDQATIFVDCQTVSAYGPGLYAKIKVACPRGRVVLLCDKGHHEHRDIVKEAMELGVYACLLAPFAEWEILAMVRHSQAPKPGGRRPRTRERQ